jgi:hypothetical protein
MRQANNPSGSFHHKKGLQDEKDADRLDAEADALERGVSAPEAPAPAKKAAPSRTGTSPVGGTKSEAPEIPNTWGGRRSEIHFHRDGVIGLELGRMGEDRLMDVDGEPLSNVLGKLATRGVMGQISQDQIVDELRRIEARLPAGSKGRQGVAKMIQDLDAPKRAPLDLPEGTPAPLQKLMQQLSEIPLARGGDRVGDHRGFSEMDALVEIAQDTTRPEGPRRWRHMESEIRRKILNHRHESMEGKFDIDRVVREAMEELERMVEEARKGATPGFSLVQY